MTSSEKCRAIGGVANCHDPQCPERLAQQGILSKAQFTKEWAGKPADDKDARIQAIQEELIKRAADLDKDDNWNAMLEAQAKFHNYSAGNVEWLLIQNPDIEQVAGFNTWKKLERNVKKGEKGLLVMAPITANVPLEDKAGNPVLDAAGKQVTVKKLLNGKFTTRTVFDISQTEGKPLPTYDRTLTETPPEGFKDDLERAISATGYTVSYEDVSGGAKGYTQPGTMKVVIKKGMTPADEVRTLSHELGHISMGHLDHLDEYHTGHSGKRGQFEVEAESFGHILTRSNGMSTDMGRSSGAYVKGWDGRDSEHLKKSQSAIAKASKLILNSFSWRNVSPDPLAAAK
jgi:antirestriction protein ArdC